MLTRRRSHAIFTVFDWSTVYDQTQGLRTEYRRGEESLRYSFRPTDKKGIDEYQDIDSSTTTCRLGEKT